MSSILSLPDTQKIKQIASVSSLPLQNWVGVLLERVSLYTYTQTVPNSRTKNPIFANLSIH